METAYYGMYGYLFAAIAYILLSLFLLTRKKNQISLPLILASLLSAAWAGFSAYALQNDDVYLFNTLPYETLRNGAWFWVLSLLISRQLFQAPYQFIKQFWQPKAMMVLIIVVCVCEFIPTLHYWLQNIIGFDFRPFVHLFLAVAGLILVEQLYRNALPEQRWGIKFLCIFLAVIFVFDFILYSKALLFAMIDTELWNVRGAIHATLVPLLALSGDRLSQKPLPITVSRRLIFHTTAILGAGVYLLLMALMGYYIRDYGGNWGPLAQIGFVFLAIVLLLVFFVSGKARALVKLYLSKHFIQHRYDYRDEWIKLSKTLAQLKSVDEVAGFIVKTLAELVDSSGGAIWVKNEQGDYELIEEYNLGFDAMPLIKQQDAVIRFLHKTQWVIDFVEFAESPEIYDGAELEKWQADEYSIWLIVPLFLQNELKALVVLTKPRVARRIDWQDHDLLKTVGMQLANALALMQTSDELSRARQFEAYNRLSAFLVHDLKNLIAQIAMIVKNAQKHKHNPEFIDDSIETLENVVEKMQRILLQLKKGGGQQQNQWQTVNLAELIEEAVNQLKQNQPPIQVDIQNQPCFIQGDRQQLCSILVHLLQNAQDATPDDGWVKIVLQQTETDAILKIKDNGCGMDKSFIQQRLFRPFDTTKGNAGMGIGVYEAREYTQQHSGQLYVESEVGQGTTFTLRFPLLNSMKTEISDGKE
jgi:putative PEP-CTERM system histidine kinase